MTLLLAIGHFEMCGEPECGQEIHMFVFFPYFLFNGEFGGPV
jgi:hypothetical protein